MASRTAEEYFREGIIKKERGDHHGAIADYTAALRIKPDYAYAFANRGVAKAGLRDYRGAIEDYTEALRIKPDFWQAFYNRGVEKTNLRDYREAIADYDGALRIKPDCAQAFHNRGVVKVDLGDYHGAIADYDEALRIKPDYVEAFYNRGLMKRQLGDYREALVDYTDALWIKPDYVEAFYNRGVARVDLRDYHGAIADFTEALRIKPNYVEAFYFRGFAKMQLEDYRGALADFTEALRIKPDLVQAFMHRGVAKEKSGDYRGALEDYTQAIQLYPQAIERGDFATRDNLEKCEALLATLKRKHPELLSPPPSFSRGAGAGSGDLRPPSPPAGGGGAGAGGGGGADSPQGPLLPGPVIPAAAAAAVGDEPLPIGRIQLSVIIPYEELTFGDELGRGGFGVVYRGTYQGAAVAIKQLEIREMSPETRAEFRRETEVMIRMHHPNVISLYGIYTEPRYGMVMEYMPKGSLWNVLRGEERLTWPVRWKIAMDVSRGVLHLHSQRVLHRDLKSLNVLVDDRMSAKVADFGLSKVRMETTASSVQSAQAIGTVAWMAPELFGKAPLYNEACDIYSLGIVLWEIASGRAPHADATNVGMLVVRVIAERRDEIPEGTPPAYAALIGRCWHARAEERPTAAEVVRELGVHELAISRPAAGGRGAGGGGAGAAGVTVESPSGADGYRRM